MFKPIKNGIIYLPIVYNHLAGRFIPYFQVSFKVYSMAKLSIILNI